MAGLEGGGAKRDFRHYSTLHLDEEFLSKGQPYSSPWFVDRSLSRCPHPFLGVASSQPIA
jgi:hypothetical protein